VCRYAFSWTYVPSCSAAVSAEAASSWARIFSPQSQVIARPNNSQTPAAGNESVQSSQAAQNPLQGERRCYACGEKGHFASQCPVSATALLRQLCPTHAPTSWANSVAVAARQNYVRGKVNHEAQEAPGVVIGTFFINDTSTVVLFDSRASHSFISDAYVEKHNLPIALLRCQMIVSSPGGDMPARHVCPNVNLKIRG
jgi:hypothetical protein